jgi:hypothetical protein
MVAVAEEHILSDPPAVTTQTYERREGAAATDDAAIAAKLPWRKVYRPQQGELIQQYQVQLPAKRESFKVIGILAGHDFMKVRIHMSASFFGGERLQFRQARARDYRGEVLPYFPRRRRRMPRRPGSSAAMGSHDSPLPSCYHARLIAHTL